MLTRFRRCMVLRQNKCSFKIMVPGPALFLYFFFISLVAAALRLQLQVLALRRRFVGSMALTDNQRVNNAAAVCVRLQMNFCFCDRETFRNHDEFR